ncbi:unnamed protein product [Moneuplotes crassus]|uniref:EF-hand domain-containing protein n=1 Tax=Euplotes crassus TaxID=5936 RepID=A0AAD1XDP9_EUPCR|nr:unnamed protein product [Moneuplotes crassus]
MVFPLSQSTVDGNTTRPLRWICCSKTLSNFKIRRRTVRFLLMFNILILVIAFLVVSFIDASKEWPYRTGYFANKLSSDTFPSSSVNSIKINNRDCITYILENKDSDEIQIDTSSERSTNIDNILEGSELSIKVHSEHPYLQCYTKIKIPGGKSLSAIAIEFSSKSSENILLYDYKDNSIWSSPLVINDLSIAIDDSNPNIFFKNEHEITNMRVTGAYCVCDFQKLKIKTMDFQVVFGSLNILQNKIYSENKITVKTPHGTHCVAGQTINTVDTSCPNQATRDEGINSTIIDTSTYCQSELYVCSNSSSSCPSSGTPISSGQGNFKLSLDDGPIQFLIDSSPTPASSTYAPKFDTFAVTSQNRLLENREEFSGNPKDPRMYIYEIMSPNLAQTWVHIFLKQYLQARVWLISILSLNFLTPTTFKYSLIHIPNATCPNAASGSIVSSTRISSQLKLRSFIEGKHVIAERASDNYYSYDITSDNRFEKEKISFLDGNIFIGICLAMMLVATIFLVILVFLMVAKLKTGLEKRYHKQLQRARTFSKAKQSHANDGYNFKVKENTDKRMRKPTKVLRIGCFSSDIIERYEIRDDSFEETIRQRIEAEQMIQLSFFKALNLEVDGYFRKRRNSFKDFLNYIEPDEQYFNDKKENNPEDIKSVSVRLDFLHSHYLDFCTRHGLKERIISEEKAVLDYFDLKIQAIKSSATSAYTKIRWKTFFEKEKHEQTKKIKGDTVQSVSELNARRTFINFNCVASRLDSDYILQEDLIERYKEYCQENKIDPVSAGSILTCQELLDFGAVHKEDFKVPHMIGITKVPIDILKMNIRNSSDHKDTNFLPGFIRRKERHTSIFDIPIRGGGVYSIFKGNSSRASLGRNLFQVIFSLAFLFGVPLTFLFCVIWSLQQFNKIESDIYAPNFDIIDIFYASSTDNWFDHLGLYWVFYLFLSLGILFIVTGLAEMICFIATDGSDTGRYPVIKTIPRWIISTLFWIMLCLYIGIYVAYYGVILLWCILGAILSPQKFLPLASGAGVIIGCVVFFYTTINKINNILDDIVTKVIEEQLQITLVNSLNNNERISKIVDTVDDLPQATFNTAVNVFLSINNLEKVDREVTDKILTGNVRALASVLQTSFMIPSEISQGIIGMLLNDPLLIINSVQTYAIKNGIKETYFVDLADFLYYTTNTKIKNRKETAKKIAQISKKILKKISPSFDCDVIDIIIKIAFENDLTPFKEILEAENLPVEILYICIGVSNKDKIEIQENILKLAKRFFPKRLYKLYYGLNKLAIKNIYGKNDFIEKALSISPCISIELIFALFSQNEETARYAMLKGIDKFCKVQGYNIDTQMLKNLYLGLSAIISSDKVDLHSLAVNSTYNFPLNEVGLLYRASQGDRAAITFICDHLRIGENSNILREIAGIFCGEEINLKEICAKLSLPLKPVNQFMILALSCNDLISRLSNMDTENIAYFYTQTKQIKDSIVILGDLLSGYQQILYAMDMIKVKFNRIETKIGDIVHRINKIRKEEFEMSMSYYKIEQLIEEIRELVDMFTNIFLDKITASSTIISDFSADNIKKDYLLSLVNVAMFISNCNDKELMFKSLKTDTYNNSIKIISYVIGVDPDKLHFIVDLFTREPSQIFRFEDKIPSINPSKLKINGNISKARLNMISEVFSIPIETVRKMGALWAYSQTMINTTTYKTVFNGVKESFITIMGKDILKVDTGFLQLILNMKTSFDSGEASDYFLSSMRDFLSTLIDKTSSVFLDQEKFNELNINLDTIWQWDTLVGKSFLSSYKKELENSSEEVQKIMNSQVNLPKKDLKNIFDILKRFTRVIITKDLSSISKGINSKPIQMLFQDITPLFDEKYIDCILTLNMIYSYSNKLRTRKYRSIRRIFIPAILLFNKNVLKEAFMKLPPRNSLFKNLTAKLKKLVKKPEVLNELEVSMENMYQCLFEAGFFDRLCAKLFKKDKESFLIDIDHKRLIRLWLHLSSDYQSRDKIINNFLKLGELGTKDDLKVFFSLVRNDSTYEKLLQKFFKDIGMPSKLGLNLLRVLDVENVNICYKAAFNLLDNECTSPQSIAAFISCFKGDISNIQILSDQLDLDSHFASIVFPLAMKNTKVDYKLLCKKLSTDRITLVTLISKIACGETDLLLRLTDSSNTFDESRFLVNQEKLQLINAVLVLIKQVVNSRKSQSKLNLKAVLNSCSVISSTIENNLLYYKQKRKIFQAEEDQFGDEGNLFRNIINETVANEGGEEELNTKNLEIPGKTAKVSPTEENKEDHQTFHADSETNLLHRDLHDDSPLQEPEQKEDSKKKSKLNFSKLVERLVLFSLGDTFAAEEILETLKSHYKRKRKYKTDFIYTIEDLKKFPEMMIERKRRKMVKEVWSLNNKNDQKVTLKSIVKKKIERDQETQPVPLGSAQRINSYVRMINKDKVYQYLCYIWNQETKNLLNQNSTEKTEPADELQDETLKVIRENNLTALHCPFVSYGYQPKDQPYYECEIKDSETPIDLCLLCAHKCQHGVITKMVPKKGPSVCKCGQTNEIRAKLKSSIILTKITPFKSPLNKCRCDQFTEIPDPEQRIEQDMEDDIDEQDNIEENIDEGDLSGLAGGNNDKSNFKRDVVTEKEKPLDKTPKSKKELKGFLINFKELSKRLVATMDNGNSQFYRERSTPKEETKIPVGAISSDEHEGGSGEDELDEPIAETIRDPRDRSARSNNNLNDEQEESKELSRSYSVPRPISSSPQDREESPEHSSEEGLAREQKSSFKGLFGLPSTFQQKEAPLKQKKDESKLPPIFPSRERFMTEPTVEYDLSDLRKEVQIVILKGTKEKTTETNINVFLDKNEEEELICINKDTKIIDKKATEQVQEDQRELSKLQFLEKYGKESQLVVYKDERKKLKPIRNHFSSTSFGRNPNAPIDRIPSESTEPMQPTTGGRVFLNLFNRNEDKSEDQESSEEEPQKIERIDSSIKNPYFNKTSKSSENTAGRILKGFIGNQELSSSSSEDSSETETATIDNLGSTGTKSKFELEPKTKKVSLKFDDDKDNISNESIDEQEMDIIDRFLKDLIDAHRLPGDISTQDLYVFDESQDKVTHLFELLCQGELSPGLIKFLTVKKTEDSDLFYCENPAESTDDSKSYSLILSILSLVDGDYTNFYRHCDMLVNTISNQPDRKNDKRKEIALTVMALIHGIPFEPDLKIEQDIDQLLLDYFSKLFKTKAETAIDLHTLLSRNQYELYQFFKDMSDFDPNLEYDKNIIHLRKKMYRMIYFKFNFDQESFEWFKTLSCLILGDIERIEFIAGEFDLSPASMDLLKAITTLKIEEMGPLFNLIQKRTKNEISVEIQKMYTNILRSDIGATFMLMFGDKNSSEKIFKKLSSYTKIFEMIISTTHCSQEEIASVLGISKKLKKAKVLLLSKDFLKNLMQLMKGELAYGKIRKVMYSLLDLAGQEKLAKFIQTHNQHVKLYDSLGGALNGNIHDFGYLCDFLFSGGRSWICSFLTAMASKSSIFCFKESNLALEHTKEIIDIHVKALFQGMLGIDFGEIANKEIVEVFSYIFVATLCRKNNDITGMINIIQKIIDLGIIDSNLLKTLKNIIEGNVIDEIGDMIKLCIPRIKKEVSRIEGINPSDLKTLDFLRNHDLYVIINTETLKPELLVSNQYKKKNLPAVVKLEDSDVVLSNASLIFEYLLNISLRKPLSIMNFTSKILLPMFHNNPTLKIASACFQTIMNKRPFTTKEIMNLGKIISQAFIKMKQGDQKLNQLGNFLNIAGDSASNLKRQFNATAMKQLGGITMKYQDVEKMYDPNCFTLLCLLMEFIDPDIQIKRISEILVEIAEIISKIIEDKTGSTPEAIPMMINIMKFIYALSKKEFSAIPEIGSSLVDSNSNMQKIISEFFGILRKYKSNIFTSERYNTPEVSSFVEDSFFFAQRQLKDPNFSVKGSLTAVSTQGAKMVKEVADDVKENVKEKATELADYVKNSSTSYIKEVMYKDLFKMFDLDQSGNLCFAEFQDLSKYMGIQMDNERALKMFSIADKDKNNSITLDEFPVVMGLLTEQIAIDTLKNLDLTSRDLILFAVLTLSYLVLALLFIFFGIFTFSRADGFNAVINSIMPLIAGAIAALRSLNLKERVDSVKEYIEDFIRKMRRI